MKINYLNPSFLYQLYLFLDSLLRPGGTRTQRKDNKYYYKTQVMDLAPQQLNLKRIYDSLSLDNVISSKLQRPIQR